jgi:hypothetical protein
MGFIENWKAGESAIGQWLAETVTGGIVKAGLAPLILWVGTEVGNWDVPGWIMVAIVGAVPVAADAVNPAAKSFGIGSK